MISSSVWIDVLYGVGIYIGVNILILWWLYTFGYHDDDDDQNE